jgi:hypothetical protein
MVFKNICCSYGSTNTYIFGFIMICSYITLVKGVIIPFIAVKGHNCTVLHISPTNHQFVGFNITGSVAEAPHVHGFVLFKTLGRRWHIPN